MNTCTWPIGNGLSLEFIIYDHNTQWNKVAGLYIFAGPSGNGRWRAYYVGQTEDFSSRLPNHERWDETRRLGATHIHAKAVPQAANRDVWEKRLIETLQPPLNVQYRGMRRVGS